jgi:Domain of unknown function (DUF6456)
VEAAERLRRDFESSGMAPKVCGSFEPRVKGSAGMLDADRQVDAWKRYKKAMDAVGQTLRPVIFLRVHSRRSRERVGAPQRYAATGRAVDPQTGPRGAGAPLWALQAAGALRDVGGAPHGRRTWVELP